MTKKKRKMQDWGGIQGANFRKISQMMRIIGKR